jgi:hypothetical protein
MSQSDYIKFVKTAQILQGEARTNRELPPVLTPDLLYSLWLNFGSYKLDGNTMPIHPVAAADVLLSPLFEEIGNELFEMEEPIRVALLHFRTRALVSGNPNRCGLLPRGARWRSV